MSEQDLTSTVQELLTEIAAMRTELNTLKSRTQVFPQPEIALQTTSKVSTTRRKLLRRLAGGLVAGLAVGGVGFVTPVEAKLSSNPSTNGLNNRAGMLVVPPGTTVNNNLNGSSTKVGLVVSSDSPIFDISVFTPTVNAALLAYTSSNGTAIVGQTQTGTGTYGQSTTGIGVSGAVTGTSTTSIGVYGSNTSGIGVSGVSTSYYGVKGESTSSTGVVGNSSSSTGVVGGSTSGIGVSGTSSTNNGISGTTSASNQYQDFPEFAGVYGLSTSTNSNTGVWGQGQTGVYGLGETGVYGRATVSDGLAGFFRGDVLVFGKLSKLSGSFKIDHPLDPANKYLYHSFVESPDMMNIYNGLVTLDFQGEATVEMPDWFEALNSDYRYQLTSIGISMPDLFIAEKLTNRKFKIAGGKSGQEVSWQVTGIRQDEWAKAHRIPVEEEKTADQKGKYLTPELFGQPETMSVHPHSISKAGLSS